MGLRVAEAEGAVLYGGRVVWVRAYPVSIDVDAMRLLGDRNWYLPGWLQWLPKVDVEGHAAAERVTIPDTPAELVEAGEPGGTGD